MITMAFYNKLSQGQKISFWAVIVAFVVGFFGLVGTLLSWFGEPIGEILVGKWLASQTPTIQTSTNIKTEDLSTITPFLYSTIVTTFKTSTETATTTKMVTETPFPFKKFVFQDDCIPLGWEAFSRPTVPLDQKCLDGRYLGISAMINGVNFEVQPNESGNIQTMLPGKSYYLNGIFMPITKDIKTIRFNITFKEPKPSPIDADVNFFIGNLNPEQIDIVQPFGDFLIYRVATMNSQTAPIILFSKNPNIPGSKQLSSFILEKPQKIAIIFNNFDYSIEIDDLKYPELQKIPNPPNDINLAFGYSIPYNGGLFLAISDFRINQ